MIIMGIDPGIARVGWAFIEPNGQKIIPIAFGCIETVKNMLPETRLKKVYEEITKLFQKYSPDACAVEELFFSTNAKTAMAVGQSRGVLLLAAAMNRIPVISYSPLTIKQTITGDGKADKRQVSRMVVLTLRLTQAPKLDDTADALAIAMTHAYTYKMKHLV